MYTNGSRYSSNSSSKRKLENGGSDDASGAKQHNYGESLSSSRAKQHHYPDNSSAAMYGEHSKSAGRSAQPNQLAFNQLLSPAVANNSSSMPTTSQVANQSMHGNSLGNLNQQSHRDGAVVGAAAVKPFMSPNQYSFEALRVPPPPPPAQYAYTDGKGSMQQYGFKQVAVSQAGYQVSAYSQGHSRYGQHNGMMGQGRGWNQRGRPPMQRFRGNQWPGPGHPSQGPGPSGPMVHPQMGPMAPPLLPPVPFGPPPSLRGFYGAPLGPRPLPLFTHQGNQHGGRNQGGHLMGSHQKPKNKKRADDPACSDANVVPSKSKGGILLSPDNKPVKNRKRNTLPTFPSRPWNREDAEKALKVEVETTINLKNESLIIRFPDPELSRDIVKAYHPGIMNVHFQVPSGPRYCFVQLAPDVNTEKIIKILENIKFGSGYLSVERKSTKQEEEATPESIDPYTLYIGNLPTNVNIQTVKEKFPDAARVDVGFAQRMRYTRYAFIRFNSVDDAIKAYKEHHNLVLDSRSIIVRFRRQKGQIDLPGEAKPQQPSKVNIRTADSKKRDEESKPSESTKKVVKDEVAEDEKEEDDEEEEEDDEDEEEEENVDDDEDDDDDDGEGEGEDDDDDDDDEEEGRKPLQDDDDDDDDDDNAKVGGPALPADDDEDDDENIFRELDAQLGGYDGFPFNFN